MKTTVEKYQQIEGSGHTFIIKNGLNGIEWTHIQLPGEQYIHGSFLNEEEFKDLDDCLDDIIMYLEESK